MESNSNNTFGTQNTGSTGTSASGIGGTTGSDNSFSRDVASDASGLADRAKSAAGAAGDKLSDVGSTVRDKAGTFKDSLADALQSGAERLRQQSGSGQMAGATGVGGSTSMVADDNRLAQTSNQIAGGMQGAADWLRDADLDGLKTGLEKQVKDHPGRTLAVAVGVGYLLGKAFRK
jgi:ElaB/YqjD/DUF883 family membrane-anchored ribosome-binding protein